MKNDIFKTELAFIKNDGIRKFTELALDNLPDYFWAVPASSGGKYHPPYALGNGGLVRHTIAAVNIAETLMSLDHYQKQLAENWHDCIISALILHDGFKQGIESKSGHTVKNHPLLASEWVRTDKLFEKSFRGNKDRELIADLIKTHMGQWDTDGNFPTTNLQKFVHTCDYLASRKTILYEFGGRTTTVDGKTIINESSDEPEEVVDAEKVIMPFGKYKLQSLGDICKENKGYLQWAIDNMDSLDYKLKSAIQQVLAVKI